MVSASSSNTSGGIAGGSVNQRSGTSSAHFVTTKMLYGAILSLPPSLARAPELPADPLPRRPEHARGSACHDWGLNGDGQAQALKHSSSLDPVHGLGGPEKALSHGDRTHGQADLHRVVGKANRPPPQVIPRTNCAEIWQSPPDSIHGHCGDEARRIGPFLATAGATTTRRKPIARFTS